jgi:hypothetical protein
VLGQVEQLHPAPVRELLGELLHRPVELALRRRASR